MTDTTQRAVVNTQVVPHIRGREVLFVGTNLRPDKEVNFFFDDVAVNNFVQKPSKLVVSQNVASSNFGQNGGVINNTTKAYAKVVSTANNILYLNENFITANMSLVVGSFSATNFAANDIVYQTNATNPGSYADSRFIARVEHWDHANAVLVMSPISGNVAVGNATSIVYKLGDAFTANLASVVANNRFAASQVVRSVDTGNTLTIVSSEHNSGIVFRANSGNSRTLFTSTNVSSSIVGNVVYVASGTGLGQARTIDNVINGAELVLNVAPSIEFSTNTKYSIGKSYIDDFGTVPGIFHIPETPNFKFTIGEKLFVITDRTSAKDSDIGLYASAKYTALGIVNTVVTPPVSTPPTQIVTPPREQPPTTRRRRRDPVAQTFFTPVPKSPKQNYGIFISSVDLFFKAKPKSGTDVDGIDGVQFPVNCRIVTTLNGSPTETIISVATVEWKDVVTSDIPDANDPSTLTKFRFPDPVYLAPDTEYALVVQSESPDYEVFISELGQDVLGSNPPRRVSEQPYVGSFFRSQNASTWTPYQNQDLMFVINKCSFTKDTIARVGFQHTPVTKLVLMDRMYLHATGTSFSTTDIDYKIKTKSANTGAMDADFITISPNRVYSFGGDLSTLIKTSSRRRILSAGSKQSINVQLEMITSDADVSPIINRERLGIIAMRNVINNAGISNGKISITNSGTGYTTNAAITIVDPDGNGSGANGYAVRNNTAGSPLANTIDHIIIDNPGFGYITTPTITIAAPAVSAGNTTATATISGETGRNGGNIFSKYISKQIVLADGFDAGDMRVYLRAIKPPGTDIHVYYKVLSGSDPDPFTNKSWRIMKKFTDFTSKDQETPVQIEFRPTLESGELKYVENNVTYPIGGKFKTFAVKIALTSSDPTVYPSILDMRTIATPKG
jgi:hypothetical protein